MACLLRLSLYLVILTTFSTVAYGQDWLPVTSDELVSGPKVDKTADAEALFWKIRMEQSESKTVLSHYVRIKIFTERGIESQSRIDLPYSGKNNIKGIAGRTIRPDGTIVDLQASSIFERTIAKAKKINVQVKSVVFPAVAVGAIIEFRWTETRAEDDPYHIPLELQRDIPIQRVEYNIKLLKNTSATASVAAFNTSFGRCAKDDAACRFAYTPLTTSVAGNLTTVATSIPAFHEEPAMPPRDASTPWLLLYYSSYTDYWFELSQFIHQKLQSYIKVTDDIRRTAMTIIGSAAAPEEKLKALYDFCGTNIKRIDDDVSGISSDVRANLKPNKSPTDTLTRKIGTGRDIDFLFIALANAAGLEARYAELGDHERATIDPNYPAPFLLNSWNVAVKINAQWKFFDPGLKYQPFGMLRWQEEGVPALLIGEKEAAFVKTQISPAEKSVTKRSATLKLSDDGTLEGDVKLWFLGHFGAIEKNFMDGMTSTEREQTISDAVKRRISSAEVTNIQIENERDTAGIISQSYHVKLPGYAQRIGKRLLLQPGYFQQGVPALFSASTRTHDIFFPHTWTEADTVSIALPVGFTLEEAEQPKAIAAGTTGKHVVQIVVSEDGRTLNYSRLLSFGLDQTLTFPASEYANIKRVFDVFHDADNRTVALIQKPQE